jgi:hypothetical protein
MDVEKKRENLTPAEKREQRYQWWLNPEIKFSSPEAEKTTDRERSDSSMLIVSKSQIEFLLSFRCKTGRHGLVDGHPRLWQN